MKKAKLLRFPSYLGVLLIMSAWVYPQDWPQWRGIHRDGKVSGFTVPDKWPEALTEHWSVSVGLGDSTPALVDNRLYVFVRQGGEEVTLCLDAASGKELWKDAYAALAVTGPPSRHPGPRSSPCVVAGKVLTLGVGGVLSCLDAGSGKLIWRKDPFPKVVPQFFTAMSPVVVDGMVIAHLGGKGEGAVIAYDLAGGQEKWRWDEEGPEYASPSLMSVADTKQIVTLTEQSIVGIGTSDGKLLWKLPFLPGRRAYNAATPIIAGDIVYYTGAGRGTKAVKIEKQADGFAAKELWSNAEVATQYNTPVLKDGFLFGLSNQGNLFCINSLTGATAWLDPTGRDRGGFTSIVDAGSVLIALPSSSELIVYEPTDKAFTEIANIKVSDTPVYAHPVIAGNRIYIKDAENLKLLTID